MNLQFSVPETKTNSVHSKALAECLVQSGTTLGTPERMKNSPHRSAAVHDLVEKPI